MKAIEAKALTKVRTSAERKFYVNVNSGQVYISATDKFPLKIYTRTNIVCV